MDSYTQAQSCISVRSLALIRRHFFVPLQQMLVDAEDFLVRPFVSLKFVPLP